MAYKLQILIKAVCAKKVLEFMTSLCLTFLPATQANFLHRFFVLQVSI